MTAIKRISDPPIRIAGIVCLLHSIDAERQLPMNGTRISTMPSTADTILKAFIAFDLFTKQDIRLITREIEKTAVAMSVVVRHFILIIPEQGSRNELIAIIKKRQIAAVNKELIFFFIIIAP